MRDAETIDPALKAAETGHLVISTLHTPDAVTTVHRIVSMFPPEEQEGARLLRLWRRCRPSCRSGYSRAPMAMGGWRRGDPDLHRGGAQADQG